MNKLAELEKKYKELGKEIEKLKLAEAELKATDKQEVGFEDDCIFLLSVEEYEKYKNKIPRISCWWWLRSPGDDSNYAALVYFDGSVYNVGYIVFYDYGAVRPALKIKNHIATKCKDGIYRITYCGVTWVQIDENLYISEMPIMFDKFDEESNDYKNSYIRNKLKEWLHERIFWDERLRSSDGREI